MYICRKCCAPEGGVRGCYLLVLDWINNLGVLIVPRPIAVICFRVKLCFMQDFILFHYCNTIISAVCSTVESLYVGHHYKTQGQVAVHYSEVSLLQLEIDLHKALCHGEAPS